MKFNYKDKELNIDYNFHIDNDLLLISKLYHNAEFEEGLCIDSEIFGKFLADLHKAIHKK